VKELITCKEAASSAKRIKRTAGRQDGQADRVHRGIKYQKSKMASKRQRGAGDRKKGGGAGGPSFLAAICIGI